MLGMRAGPMHFSSAVSNSTRICASEKHNGGARAICCRSLSGVLLLSSVLRPWTRTRKASVDDLHRYRSFELASLIAKIKVEKQKYQARVDAKGKRLFSDEQIQKLLFKKDSLYFIQGYTYDNYFIYFSSDGGKTFTTLLDSSYGNFSIAELGDAIYISRIVDLYSKSGTKALIRSQDHGKTWQDISPKRKIYLY